MAPLPQPDLPEPAHPHVDSMLSRKFGKEVANYFSGSPLNRVSFLRPDHTFLSSALRHPSATFVLFRNIEPLVQSPTSLARVSYADVEPIIGKNIFNTTEEDVIAQYNSSLYIPQIVFLGLDERKEGFVYKEHYKGQPWFAVDVTPKESVKDEAEKLISKLQSQGLDFSKGRMHLSLPAEEGSFPLPQHAIARTAERRTPY
jgi:NAD+ diphosphatase